MFAFNGLKEKLDLKPEMQKYLLRRGYFITNRSDVKLDAFPFYGNWRSEKINENFTAYLHNDQRFYKLESDGMVAVMIGHAYNPFDEKISEMDILSDCISAYKTGKSAYFDKISELTGIHIIAMLEDGKLTVVQDCCGMMSCYYGKLGDNVYFTSNIMTVANVDTPSENKMVKKLLASRSYRYGTKYLPGDSTVFDDFFRLGPNVYLTYESGEFSISRFYPLTDHKTVSADSVDTVDEIRALLSKNVELCARKWNKPAISLSGGMDSRTTLSSARNVYDKFYYYSFHSKPQEVNDAYAAKDICAAIGQDHSIYPIAENNEDCEGFALFKDIVYYNSADVSRQHDNEIRKYLFLSTLDDFDVELKSWISEVGRAYWGRRYGIELPERLTARHLSIFQTRYIAAPILLRKSDRAYREYMKKSGFEYPMCNYEMTDMFYWEFRWGSWGTLVTAGQNIFNFEVTMPMNNRKIMDMFLWYPHDTRKADGVHRAIIERNDERLISVGKNVHNDYMNKKRLFLERLYYRYRTLFVRK